MKTDTKLQRIENIIKRHERSLAQARGLKLSAIVSVHEAPEDLYWTRPPSINWAEHFGLDRDAYTSFGLFITDSYDQGTDYLGLTNLAGKKLVVPSVMLHVQECFRELNDRSANEELYNGFVRAAHAYRANVNYHTDAIRMNRAYREIHQSQF